MVNKILVLLLAICFCACSANDEKKPGSESVSKAKPVKKLPEPKPNEFTGKVYLVGELMNEGSCEIETACDCCNSEILFLTDSTFIISSYCIPEESYSKGTYQIQKNNLTLKYDSLSVTTGFDETDTLAVNPRLKVGRKPFPDSKFEITTCKKKTMLVIRYKGVKEYSKANPEKKLATEIQLLKESGIWQTLQMD